MWPPLIARAETNQMVSHDIDSLSCILAACGDQIRLGSAPRVDGKAICGGHHSAHPGMKLRSAWIPLLDQLGTPRHRTVHRQA